MDWRLRPRPCRHLLIPATPNGKLDKLYGFIRKLSIMISYMKHNRRQNKALHAFARSSVTWTGEFRPSRPAAPPLRRIGDR